MTDHQEVRAILRIVHGDDYAGIESTGRITFEPSGNDDLGESQETNETPGYLIEGLDYHAFGRLSR